HGAPASTGGAPSFVARPRPAATFARDGGAFAYILRGRYSTQVVMVRTGFSLARARSFPAVASAPNLRSRSDPMATILCLDDEAAALSALRRILTRLGHTVLTAGTAVEALQHLARSTVALVLSDYQMPGITGLDFLALLQE